MASEQVTKPPNPEMIMEAIDVLKEKEGSNKSSIGRYIASTYGDLPAGHMDILADHLNKMKEDGELVQVKNNYLRPDPNAPPKRGRGRPPKAKDPNAPEKPAPEGPSRGRGRPKKESNAPAPPAAKKAKAEKATDPTPSKSGKPRGRPKKVQPQLAQNGVEAN